MANATITVLEADGTTETDVVVLDVGRQAAAASKSVAASTEDKAVLDAMAASLALLDNAIPSGNELQVDVVAALPAGTNAIGKVKVTNDAGTVIDPVAAGAAAKTGSVPVTMATDEDWIKAEDAAHSSGDKGVMALAIKKAVAASTSATDNDYVPLVVDADGNLYVSARPGGVAYETVAASQTAQAIGATGAAGDYLSHVIVSPATAGCGVCTILDGTTEIAAFPGGGTTALSNLIPFVIPIGMKSTAGAWKITTGANIKCVAVGKFT